MDFAAIQTSILAELKAEGEKLGVRGGMRNTFRTGSKADRLLREITVYGMMGTLSLERWAKHGVTYEMLRDAANAGIVKIQPDRHRNPCAAGLRK